MKYMGSKSRIAKYILPIILKDRKPAQCYVCLLYTSGLWNFSDDSGTVIGDSIWLKSKIFPYDQIQIQQFEKWMNELVINGFKEMIKFFNDKIQMEFNGKLLGLNLVDEPSGEITINSVSYTHLDVYKRHL